LRRGLEPKPDRRWPSIDALLARIARWQRGRVIPLALGGTGAVAVALTVGAVALSSKRAPPCAYDASLLVGRWDAVRRAELRVVLADPKRQAKLDAVLAALDEHGRTIADGLSDTCRAQRAEEISEAEARVTASCLARRAFELDALVSRYLAAKPRVDAAASDVQTLATPRDCSEVVAPPLTPDPARAIALFERFGELVAVTPTTAASAAATAGRDVDAAGALERDATAANELELAARAAFAIGMFEVRRGRADAADEALQRAHRLAVDVRNGKAARCPLSSAAGSRQVRSDARRLQLAEPRSSSPETEHEAARRTRAYKALVARNADRGDLTAAAPTCVKRSTLCRTTLADPFTELTRASRWSPRWAGSTGNSSRRSHRTRHGRRARHLFGEHHAEYAVAPTWSAPRSTQRVALQPIAVPTPGAPSRSMRRPRPRENDAERLDLAGALVDAHELAEAKQQIAIVMAMSSTTPSYVNRPLAFATAGRVAFETGDFDEGVRLLDEAVEANIELGGSNTTNTEAARALAIGAQLELGHAGDAERRIATLERSYRTHSDDSAEPIARLGGLKAEVERLRGQKARAVELARAARAAAEQHHAATSTRASLSYRPRRCAPPFACRRSRAVTRVEACEEARCRVQRERQRRRACRRRGGRSRGRRRPPRRSGHARRTRPPRARAIPRRDPGEQAPARAARATGTDAATLTVRQTRCVYLGCTGVHGTGSNPRSIVSSSTSCALRIASSGRREASRCFERTKRANVVIASTRAQRRLHAVG
jgi:hypothetical protein